MMLAGINVWVVGGQPPQLLLVQTIVLVVVHFSGGTLGTDLARHTKDTGTRLLAVMVGCRGI